MSVSVVNRDWEDEYQRIKEKNEEFKSVINQQNDQIKKYVVLCIVYKSHHIVCYLSSTLNL